MGPDAGHMSLPMHVVPLQARSRTYESLDASSAVRVARADAGRADAAQVDAAQTDAAQAYAAQISAGQVTAAVATSCRSAR